MNVSLCLFKRSGLLQDGAQYIVYYYYEAHTYITSCAIICDLFFYSFISMNAHTKKKMTSTLTVLVLPSFVIFFCIPLYPRTHTPNK